MVPEFRIVNCNTANDWSMIWVSDQYVELTLSFPTSFVKEH